MWIVEVLRSDAKRYDKYRKKIEASYKSDIEKIQTKNGIDVVDEYSELLILGKPGSGKTTFLKHIALMALDGKLKHIEPNNRLRLVQIDIEILIDLKKDIPKEKFDLCYQSFQEFCPISHILTHGISLNIEVKRN